MLTDSHLYTYLFNCKILQWLCYHYNEAFWQGNMKQDTTQTSGLWHPTVLYVVTIFSEEHINSTFRIDVYMGSKQQYTWL